MEPTYFVENRYSFVVDALRRIDQADYEVETPETRFERNIQLQLALANHLLVTSKYSAALDKYRYIRGLIATTMRPQISVFNATLIEHAQVDLGQLVKPLVTVSAELLQKTPVTDSTLPEKFRTSNVILPADVSKHFVSVEAVGIRDREAGISGLLDQAAVHVRDREFKQAAEIFQSVLDQTDDGNLHGSLFHDLAIVRERAGNRDEAMQMMQRSIRTFAQQDNPDMQVVALAGLAGIQVRSDDTDGATRTLETISNLAYVRGTCNFSPHRLLIPS